MADRPDWEAGGFGLYIHWPFCAAKCPYCDFNSHVVSRIDHARWTSAYLSELRRNAELTEGRVLRTVYFGGGTPSLMDPATVAAILAEIRKLWPLANDLEVTLEANPTSVEAGRFAAFRDAGVSRVSMGIQALNNRDLKALGRLHSVAEAREAFDIARQAFERVSFDLIYARQGQSLEAWRSELTEALDMASDHLSLYQLTIEPGTAFGDRFARGKLRHLPDENLSADLFDLTQELCAAAGMPGYEISNHARAGEESRHNLIYWRYGDYIGIGPGAHGRLSRNSVRYATETPLAPARWLEDVETTGSGERPPTPLSGREQGEEYLMMSLRLAEGTRLSRLNRLGIKLPTWRLEQLQEHDLVRVDDDLICATRSGKLVLNAILRDLLVEI